MVFLSRLATVLFVIAIPLLLVTTNVRFFAGEVRFYERGFREYNAATKTGVPLAELDASARQIIDYFENDNASLRILVTHNGEEVSLFNTRETDHMRDVKNVMRIVFRVNEISLAYVLTYITAVFIWSREKSLRSLAKLSLLGVAVGIAAVAAIGGFALAGFDSAWTTFHEILFRNDLWQLNPATDRLIQMFPEPFWEESTYLIGIMTLAEATLIVIASLAYLLFSRQPATREPSRVQAAPPAADAATPPDPHPAE